jgi:ACT domain-containing protein
VSLSEEEIRRITLEAINELGDKASPALVKSIVANAVNKLDGGTQTEVPTEKKERKFDRAILTSFGINRPGVVAQITALLSEAECDLRDISQKIMEDFYTLIMIVDLSNSKYSMKELDEKLNAIAEKLNIKIFLQHEEVFRQMHRI